MRHARESRDERWLKVGSFAVGLCVVAVALLAWRVPAGSTTPAAEISLSTFATGELGVVPAGTVLRRIQLEPSTRARAAVARLTVRNQTAGDLAVSVRAPARTRDLDTVVRVAIEAGRQPLFAGRLAGLRRWTRSFRLASGKSQQLRIRAWIPVSRRSGWQAGVADVTLEYRVQAVGGRS